MTPKFGVLKKVKKSQFRLELPKELINCQSFEITSGTSGTNRCLFYNQWYWLNATTGPARQIGANCTINQIC